MADFTAKPTVTLTGFNGAKHLQDITTDGDFVYWCFTNSLAKSGFDGVSVADVSFADSTTHYGGICHNDGFIYIAWTDTGFGANWGVDSRNKIKVYNASDLSYVTEFVLNDFDGGIGCIAYRLGKFYVGETSHSASHPLRVFEYDTEFNFIKHHTIIGDVADLGIETFDWINGRWFMTTAITGLRHIYTDADFNVLETVATPTFTGNEGITAYRNNQLLNGISSDLGGSVWEGTFTPQIESLALNQSVMAKYAMEDDKGNYSVADSSNNKNHGLLQTLNRFSSVISSDAGKIGKCFNMAQASIDYAAALPLPLGDDSFTVAAWVKPTAARNNQILNQEGTDPRFYFRVGSGKLTFLVDDGVGLVQTIGQTNISDGAWHLVIGIVDRTAETISVYVDNSLDVTAVSITGLLTLENNNALLIGKRGTSGGENFDGLMDEAMVFDKALTEAERTELWNDGAGTNLIPLIDGVPTVATGGYRSRYS